MYEYDVDLVVDEKDNRMSLEEQVYVLMREVLEESFPDLKDEHAVLFTANEKYGDYQCDNVLSIWLRIRDDLQMYPHIKKPRDVGEQIKKHLEKRDMIRQVSVHDIGFVTFKLSGKWMSKSIHNMVKLGIDTWAPKFYVGKVMVNFPPLDKDTVARTPFTSLRRSYILNTLVRMLEYSRVDFTVFEEYPQEDDKNTALCKVEECFSFEESEDGIVTIFVVGPEGERKPIICGKKDAGFGNASQDLSYLWYGVKCEKAEWMVNVIPAQRQEYYEMLFSAARQVEWLAADRYESPAACYAGYRICSNEVDQLITFLQQMETESVDFALLDDALAYTFLKTHRLADCSLNIAEMVKAEGNTIQHLLKVLAQIRSFTTKYREDVDELKKVSELTFGEGEVWEEGVEHALGLHLLIFSEVLKESCVSVLPHILCKYLHDLSEKFERYSKFYGPSVCEDGFVVEQTNRLLLYEATAVVMEKCFHLLGINSWCGSYSADWCGFCGFCGFVGRHPEGPVVHRLLALSSAERPMDVNVPVADAESDNKKQKMAFGGAPEDSVITRLLTPAARDPPKNPRIELFSICLNVTRDIDFRRGKLLGHISVSDNVGLLWDAWGETHESECGLVTLFNCDWFDSEDMDNFRYLYFGNISSRQSIPFSSYIEICMKLFVTNDEKDVVFQLCDYESDRSFSKIWKQDTDSTCCALKAVGQDGYVIMHYILLKDAVDAAIEITCTTLADNLEVCGEIFAYYGNNFDYQCKEEVLKFQRSFYSALLYEDDPKSVSIGANIPLRKTLIAVPNKGGSLVIQFMLTDGSGNEILNESREFDSQTEGCVERNLTGLGCSFRLKVDWSQGKGCDKAGLYL